MCVIAVSAAGKPQPSIETIRRMFHENPHGAGYMFARDGQVTISKGYMSIEELETSLRYEHFTAADPVVYHFRISTQAGVKPEMCHPFPLTASLEQTEWLDLTCPIGVAHNGIIQLTTDPTDKRYSDTAHYIVEILRFFVRNPGDLRDQAILSAIYRTAKSKFVLMDGEGYIATIGDFIEDTDGNLYSNPSFRERRFTFGGR